MGKCTPGLWHVRDGAEVGEYHVCAPGHTVAVCDARPPEECEANARLIAAAPELLEACKKSLEWLEGIDPEQEKKNDGLDNLRQTIAKATK